MIPTDSYRSELEVAISAAREAAALCEAVRVELAATTLEKKDRSPVTVADYGSQALICRAIHEAFPDDAIVAEESAGALREAENQTLLDVLTGYVRRVRSGANERLVRDWIDYGSSDAVHGRFWTLDPIDGTKGFLRNDQYAVALALIENGELKVAVLGCPRLQPASGSGEGTLFIAVAGEGAYQVSINGNGEASPIRVSTVSNPRDLRFCESVEAAHSSHSDAARIAAELGIEAPPRRLDSQAKYGLVARGDAEIYLRMPRGTEYKEKIWDHAAGALVVTEAGGTVTDLQGDPLDFTHGRTLAENYGLLASNGTLHSEILGALESLGMTRPNP